MNLHSFASAVESLYRFVCSSSTELDAELEDLTSPKLRSLSKSGFHLTSKLHEVRYVIFRCTSTICCETEFIHITYWYLQRNIISFFAAAVLS